RSVGLCVGSFRRTWLWKLRSSSLQTCNTCSLPQQLWEKCNEQIPAARVGPRATCPLSPAAESPSGGGIHPHPNHRRSPRESPSRTCFLPRNGSSRLSTIDRRGLRALVKGIGTCAPGGSLANLGSRASR